MKQNKKIYQNYELFEDQEEKSLKQRKISVFFLFLILILSKPTNKSFFFFKLSPL